MKKILKYSMILGTVGMLTASVAQADTGGYVRIKGFESHLSSLGFTTCQQAENLGAGAIARSKCKFASGRKDNSGGDAANRWANNELRWNEDDGEGIVVGADFGFFRLEAEGTYQDGAATQWRDHAATDGTVHQFRLFGNVVAEPFDLLELLGEFGGIEPLVTYNPAHYGISPYAMYGIGIMGGVLENLSYDRKSSSGSGGTKNTTAKERGAWGGGATAAVNAGAGVNFSLDKLARGVSSLSGASMPEYFKLPIEFQIGYHWQVGLDEHLFESPGEKLGIDDGGLTYSVGLKW